MTTKPVIAERQSFRKRFAIPVSIVFVCWAVSTLIYNNAWRFLPPGIHRPLAAVCAVLMGVSIAFGAALVYPLACSRGASLRERVIGCFITPLCWILKELYVLPDAYTIGEKVFYAFSPLILGLLSLTVIQMGICEIVCRLAARRKTGLPAAGPAIGKGPAIAILVGMCGLYFFNVYGDRVGFWYIHQAVYQCLFVK